MNKIAAIVVTYNRVLLLKECIEALTKYADGADILIIDNNSTDNTKETVSHYVDNQRVFYYNTGKNLGGAGGFNYGLKVAYEKGYDYFWLMDDDTIVEKNTLKELVKAIDIIPDSKFGYLSSIAYWIDGSICIMNDQTPTNDIKGFNKDKWMIKDGIVRITRSNFVSFFVSKEAVRKVGLPIKEYFIWGDDSEYSSRVAQSFPCYLVAKSRVTHKMKENRNSTGDILTVEDLERIERVQLSTRNDCCTYRRRGIRPFLKFTKGVYSTIFTILRSDCIYKRQKVKAFFMGWVKGVFFRPEIEYVSKKRK